MLTDIDLTEIVAFHEKNDALATIGAERGGEPARVRHRHHPRGRRPSSASWRSPAGARSSATPSTPASTCSSPRSSTCIPAGRSVDFSSEVFPAAARGRRGRSSATWPTGYWEDVGTTAAYLQGARGHPRRQGGRRHLRLRAAARASGWARGRRSTRWPGSSGRRSSARTARSTRGAVLGAYTDDRRQRAGGRAGRDPALGHRRELLPRPGVRVRGRRARALVRPAAGRALRAGRRWSARAASSARTPRCAATSRSTPTRSVEAGARCNSSIVWESGGARTLFGRDGVAGHRQRRHQPRAGRAPGQGVGVGASRRARYITTSRDTSRAARVLKRALMVGLQLGRASTSPTSRWPPSR